MADNDFGKKIAECPNCSSTSQKGASPVSPSKTRFIPALVVETSDTSSSCEPDSSSSLDRKKQQIIKYKAVAKNVVNIKNSISEHKSKSHV